MPLFNMVSDYIVVIQMCTLIWKFKKKRIHIYITNLQIHVQWLLLNVADKELKTLRRIPLFI